MPAGWNVDVADSGPVEVEIGMRWTALWRLAARPWVPRAFLGMVRPGENAGLRRSGVRVTPSGPALVQVWEDHRALDDWARSSGASHASAWSRFAREADGTAAWGIWHRVSSP